MHWLQIIALLFAITFVVCTVKTDIGILNKQIRDQFGITTFKIAFVAYRDWHGGGERLEVHPFSEDIESVGEFISNIEAVGGGDAAEDVLGGLCVATELQWSSEIKILYHICDAPPHGTTYHDLFGLDNTVSADSDDEKEHEDSDSDSSNDDDIHVFNERFLDSGKSKEVVISEEEKNELDRFPGSVFSIEFH